MRPCMKYEGQSFTMIFRRVARPVTVLLALWCLWQIPRTEFGAWNRVLIPLVEELPPPPPPPVKPVPRIAKVTVAANTLNSSIIDQALQTHQVQNDLHGYLQFTAPNELVGDISENDHQKRPRGAWSKPAYLMSVIVAELAKPEAERLKWVFWFDADTVVLNPHTPLEIFLPPSYLPEVHNVHLLMASNWDGLNSGAFALRVDPWSVSLLSAVLAYPIYQAQRLKSDRFRDQSAFQWLLQSKESPLASMGFTGRNQWEHWVEIPMRWFNSLPFNNAFSKKQDWIFNYNMTEALFDNGTDVVYNDGKGRHVQPWKVMQGDMLVHFAGANPVRDSWMGPWLQRANEYLPEWSNITKQEDLKIDAYRFWNTTSHRMVWERDQENQKGTELQRHRKPATGGGAGTMLQPTPKKNFKAPSPPPVPELRQNEVHNSDGSRGGSKETASKKVVNGSTAQQ